MPGTTGAPHQNGVAAVTGRCSGPGGQGRGPPRSRASRARVSRPSQNRAGSAQASRGMGSVARSMPGSRPVARWGGGGPPWASISTRTSPEGPAATPGTARGSRRHQAVILAGPVVAARTPWHQPPAGRQGQAPARWAAMPCRGRQAPQLPSGRLLTGDSGRMCQPSAASSSASRAGSLDAGMDRPPRGVAVGAGGCLPVTGLRTASGVAGEPGTGVAAARWDGGAGIPRPPGAGRVVGVRIAGDGLSLMSAGPETVCELG